MTESLFLEAPLVRKADSELKKKYGNVCFLHQESHSTFLTAMPWYQNLNIMKMKNAQVFKIDFTLLYKILWKIIHIWSLSEKSTYLLSRV